MLIYPNNVDVTHLYKAGVVTTVASQLETHGFEPASWLSPLCVGFHILPMPAWVSS